MKTTIVLGGILLGGLGLGALTTEKKEAPKQGDYVLHEWGTFTTVSGSDGVLLTGLQREEEHLPSFVHSHFGMENGTRRYNPINFLQPNAGGGKNPVPQVVAQQMMMFKGFWRRDLRNVAVKMETPVVYFYTDEELKVDLRVGFKGGSISQWFPQRAEGETPPKVSRLFPVAKKEGEEALSAEQQAKSMGVIDFGKGYDGWIRWKVDVLPRDEVDPVKLFRSEETLAWTYPKVQKAAVVRNELGEHEDYLFYRGVGNFAQPVTTTVDSEENLGIHNTGSEKVPFAFVFERDKGVTRYAVLKDGVKAGESVVVKESEMTAATKNWKEEVYVPMRDGLVRAGLYPEEADGMVRTWWKSYLETQGLRVFWVEPQGFTNEVLPMEISPAPKESVRIIVGRSEVLRPRFEQELVAKITSEKEEDEGWENRYLNDRFGIAYQQRVKALTMLPKTVKR